ncbi:MAG: uroporphyrinogen decarboxylase [Nitrospinota bacterium]|nr:MAG: uroporphyrinogen decarboxylase [Nitrospinota bacterium]
MDGHSRGYRLPGECHGALVFAGTVERAEGVTPGRASSPVEEVERAKGIIVLTPGERESRIKSQISSLHKRLRFKEVFMAGMSKKERVQAALQGQEVDRPPVSFWRHFFEKETSAEGLAEAMLTFQQRFDWDFMKVNPRACYHVEDWGCRFRFSGDPHTAPVLLEPAVRTVQDWEKITVLPPDQGALGEQLQALKLIKEGLQDEIYFLETIFTPLSIAGRLIGSEAAMKEQMQNHPEAVHAALERITETYRRFARACLEVGASGIFFATTAWASYELLTDAEYAEFGRPYDLKVLEAVQDAEFNLLHVCRSRNMLYRLADYPVHAINWASRDPSNPSLREGKAHCTQAVVGGIDHRKTLLKGSVEEVVAQAREAKAQTEGIRWILAGECSIPTRTPERNLTALREAVEKL